MNDYLASKITKLEKEEEEKLEKNLIWIFGYDKTRIRILGELLSSQTYFMNEPELISHINFQVWSQNSPISSFNNWEKKGKNPKYDYFFFSGFQQTWKFYLKKLILNRIYSQFHDLNRKIVISESDGYVGAELILDILPKSKAIIFLEDDVKGVINKINSYQTLSNSKPNIPILISTKNRMSLIENVAKLWNFQTECMINAYSKHNKELSLIIKYEEINRSILEFIQKISKFLKIELEASSVKKFSEENNSYDKVLTKEKLNSDNYDKNEIKVIKTIIKRTGEI